MRLVVFDVDGTLVDSQHQINASMTGAFAALGLPAPSLAATRAIVGLSLPEAMARLAPEQSEAAQAALVQAYRAGFKASREAGEAAPLFAGARAAVEALGGRPDVLLGIATGKSRRGLRHLLDGQGWQGLFVTTQTADDNPSKPHPAMLRAAMDEAGAGPAETAMVGDTTYDLEMARAAGCAAVGVCWGYHPPEALAPLAPLARDFDHLLSLIGEMP